MGEIRNIFILLSTLFILSCCFGYFLAGLYPDFAKKEIEIIKNLLRNITAEDVPPLAIFAIILLNNTIKSFGAMILGIFLGIIPVLFIAINGAIIGIFAKVFGEEIGAFTFLMKILPHGVIEIPAIILASSYGVWLGLQFLRDRRNIDKHLRYATSRFLKVVFPMLIVAAAIETTLITIFRV